MHVFWSVAVEYYVFVNFFCFVCGVVGTFQGKQLYFVSILSDVKFVRF
jgi:hypothetical protein